MNTPPVLSYACPLPWSGLTGSERIKFCSQCGHHVANVSLLSNNERQRLYERAQMERVCGAYLMRLSGEMVTPEAPLTDEERAHVRQVGVGRLSTAALAVAAACLSPLALTAAETAAKGSPREKKAAVEGKAQPEIDEKKEVILLMGMWCPMPPKTVMAKPGPRSKR